ncbi:LOW QUALITY PROTEIN: WSCD family member CG9164 [Drosophila sulfurigaster albostrigata]|uniref:LOW QUALITY PROTEIN: WSCD family member CG9164 n=1 Tax=Drosophila sulfurigaster albostrigata TaxID=89887 RepID=UPI002D21A00C|nr:LOW QUALITY PROTEIN: WSCD family member CG9164 [Drosophila sulfurigaster albostrigata]
MALQGWRFFGVSATIIIYIGGVLFLSMNNIPGSHPKRTRIERFAEFSSFHSPRFPMPSRKMTIRWCRDLKYLNRELPNYTDDKAGDFYTAVPSSDVSASLQMPSAPMLTALASFPGSGNTWLRYLLQQATGILTGSIYKDYGLLKTGFPAENVCNSSVLLVKTHEWGSKAWAPFSKAILLVRDPEKAIIAEFNRQSGGHIGFASPDRYKRTKGKYWQQFVSNKLKGWELMNLSWARNFTGSIKVVFYDDLVHHTERELRNILDFLEFPVSEQLMRCAIMRKEGIFRRKKRLLSFDPYTDVMRAELLARRRLVYGMLGRLKDND